MISRACFITPDQHQGITGSRAVEAPGTKQLTSTHSGDYNTKLNASYLDTHTHEDYQYQNEEEQRVLDFKPA
jgi:hypothetical protein